MLIKILLVLLLFVSCSKPDEIIDLSGEWTVRIDSVAHKVILPGSLSENGIGIPVTDSAVNMLTDPFRYEGIAVYEREIEVPASWRGKTVLLCMERTKISEVTVNGKTIGQQNSVSAPHIYVLDKVLEKGKNRIKIKIDNTRKQLPLGGSHAYSEHTQTNWNGILGDFFLKRMNALEVTRTRIDASIDGLCVVTVNISNDKGQSVEKQFVKASIANKEGKIVATEAFDIDLPVGNSRHTFRIKIDQPTLWDEYTPDLYALKIEIGKHIVAVTQFGIRDFRANGARFSNNGRTVFLRGKNDCAIFPQTGYANMQKEDWLRYFTIAKSYGINHVRFHSWTPPRAAFHAADETGVFLQPELPLWGRYTRTDTVLVNYMKNEGRKIMNEYGNHPSFVMFSLGNELEGDTSVMADVVGYLKEIDNRHLYALGTNNHYWDPQTHPIEDFFVAMRHGKERPGYGSDLRGSFSFADSKNGGIINVLEPNTMRDFSSAKESLGKPAVGHETGQYQIYPDYGEIEKYTGLLQPRNLMIFRKRLEEKGLLSLAPSYLKASGALSALCYREEIEMALRTPGLGGFQLLDLQDFPGQGTALVGILNAFMDSKEVISREKWTEFCNDVVPLARFEKYCWSGNEEFTAVVDIANYGRESIRNANVRCSMVSEKGEKLFEQIISGNEIKQGALTSLGTVGISLKQIKHPQKMSFSVILENTPYKNSWDIWVYPSAVHDTNISEGIHRNVLVTRDGKMFEKAIKQSKPVLYIPRQADIENHSTGGLFITDFWNYGVFRQVARNMKVEPSPGTLGLLIHDTEHEIFGWFPTDFHTNWQWWNIVKHSRPVILDDTAADYLPLVQVIDNVDRNHKLGLIFQPEGANDKALVCSADLFACKEKTEAKALFCSLVNYLSNK